MSRAVRRAAHSARGALARPRRPKSVSRNVTRCDLTAGDLAEVTTGNLHELLEVVAHVLGTGADPVVERELRSPAVIVVPDLERACVKRFDVPSRCRSVVLRPHQPRINQVRIRGKAIGESIDGDFAPNGVIARAPHKIGGAEVPAPELDWAVGIPRSRPPQHSASFGNPFSPTTSGFAGRTRHERH